MEHSGSGEHQLSIAKGEVILVDEECLVSDDPQVCIFKTSLGQ